MNKKARRFGAEFRQRPRILLVFVGLTASASALVAPRRAPSISNISELPDGMLHAWREPAPRGRAADDNSCHTPR